MTSQLSQQPSHGLAMIFLSKATTARASASRQTGHGSRRCGILCPGRMEVRPCSAQSQIHQLTSVPAFLRLASISPSSLRFTMSVVTITSPPSRPVPPPLNLLLVGGAEIQETHQVSDAYIPPGSPMSLDRTFTWAVAVPRTLTFHCSAVSTRYPPTHAHGIYKMRHRRPLPQLH
jgi:hypothetical protein